MKKFGELCFFVVVLCFLCAMFFLAVFFVEHDLGRYDARAFFWFLFIAITFSFIDFAARNFLAMMSSVSKQYCLRSE